MKYILLKSISAVVIAMGLTLASCSKWTDVEAKEIDHNGGKIPLAKPNAITITRLCAFGKKQPRTTVAQYLLVGLATGRPKAVCAKGILQRCPIV